MSAFRVLLAQSRNDILVGLIADAVRKSDECELVRGDAVNISAIESVLYTSAERIDVLIVIGESDSVVLEELLARHHHIVVSHIIIGSDTVRFGLKSLDVNELLSTLTALARNRGHGAPRSIQYRAAAGTVAPPEQARAAAPAPKRGEAMELAVAWLGAVLRQYNRTFVIPESDIPGLPRANATIERALSAPPPADDDGIVRELAERLAAALAVVGRDDDPLVCLHQRLGLSTLETKLLVLCLAPELDPKFHRVVGSFNDDMTRHGPTLALACRMLGEPREVRAALARTGGLVRWQLLDCGPSLPRGDDVLRVDRAISDWLMDGSAALLDDPALRPVISLKRWRGASLLTQDFDAALADKLNAHLAPSDERGRWLVLGGPDIDGWRALVELASVRDGVPLLRVDLQALASLPPESAASAIARIVRAGRLLDLSPVITSEIDETNPNSGAAVELLAHATASLPQGTTLIAAEPRRFLGAVHGQLVAVFERDAPAAPVTAARFSAAAAHSGLSLADQSCIRLGHAFPLALGDVEDAVRIAALQGAGEATPDLQHDAVAAACRHVANPDLPRFAKRIVPSFTLDDIVLPADYHGQLREIVGNVANAATVLDQWGFATCLPTGRGIAALFHGPSGTGKTSAAQAVAHALGTDVFQADLSLLESKFIGETAKNVDAIFCDAEKSRAVLCCDEADAILGKRSEIKDAHDRYANIDVAYLLQRIESYSGLVILTTNFRQNIDQAFLRRFRFMIEFPRPDAPAREQIWRKCLPGTAPVAGDVDFGLLARRFDLTGGHIRQITLRAAFAAAGEQAEAIAMRHILAATRAELIKAGMVTAIREIDDLEAARRRVRQVA